MSQPFHVLAVAKTSPLLLSRIRDAGSAFVLHDRLHETDPAAFAQVAGQIRGVVGGGESVVSAELVGRLPHLELVSIFGVGYDGVDVPAVKARGARVSHTPAVLNDDVADLALALMLCAARQIPAADRFVRSGAWPAGAMPLQRKLSGSRLGLVGLGRIGQAIAKRAQAFDMAIRYHTRSPRADQPYLHEPDLVKLAADSDFLVVITPGGAATRHLVSREVMKALGPQGILVNVARGSVVDQEALIDLLSTGELGGAGLDVFADEPQVPQALMDLPHVVLTPHVGSATHQTRAAMGDLSFANLLAQAQGRPLLSPVPECQDD